MQAAGRIAVFVAIGIAALGSFGQARATSNYAYKPGEYLLVSKGMSPDKHQSIRTHGDGDLGTDNFHVYLFRENPKKRVGPLEEIEPLDTGPDGFTAFWAPDSKAVAIQYRSDRHSMDITAYQLANNRAYLIKGPSMIDAAIGRTADGLAEGRNASATEWVWTSSTRFTMRVTDTYHGKAEPMLHAFGRYGQKADDLDDGNALVLFSVEAECELTGDHSYKVLSIKPGDFDQ